MRVKAFPALVPAPGQAPSIASVPYDVVNTAEARALAEGRPNSFLRVVRAELELPEDTDPYSDAVYENSRRNFERLQKEGLFVREPEPCVYLYRQIMDGRAQTGITLCCHIEDYENDLIRKHEKTRKVKEDDRTRLTDVLSANTGPVFLTYKDVDAVDAFVSSWCADHEPSIDFVDDVNVRHTVWRVTADEASPILEAIGEVPLSYVADGHHRSASAARVGKERRDANPDHDGTENYNWFMAVMFPASQLKILPYNRVVKDLNGMSADGFLKRLADGFRLDSNGKKSPDGPESVCVYLDGKWHTLGWDPVESESPIDRLDVSFLQDHILTPLLGIGDPRTDERIDFIGGIRGTAELEKRVDSGEWAVAFSMYPTTVQQLIDIADAGEIMPPKSTWFEPKLRSGLFVYTLD
ncbi:MAG: DUF1015 domain-containing protein [Verrucomicrobiae bacterium]|nr:DUF1015 domain-containing protein [Verrucomicrobiae bacterium]